MTDLGISGIGDAELIASGGSALVYQAEDATGTPVAVKVLRGIRGTEVARRFEREQSAAERLQEHANIINVHSTGVSAAGEPYLVMPLMQRGSLADELDRDGAFDLDQAIDDVATAADAIDFAHRRGVLHRDLKPGNLLRSDDDSIVVTDFGIARVLDAGITSATIGATTPLYAAPELLEENEASAQSDVYALGAMLYALLAGAPAFSDSANIWATIGRIRSDAAAVIDGVPAPVMRVIEQAMAKEPMDRPPTAAQFRTNLLDARQAGPNWRPPAPAEMTVTTPPAPPMVPAVPTQTVEFDRPNRAPTPVETAAQTQPALFDVPTTPTSPSRSNDGLLKVAAVLGAIMLLGAAGWFGVNSLFGDTTPRETVTEPTGPVDTSLPPLTPVPTAEPDAVTEEELPTDVTPDPADIEPDEEPTPTDRLVSFNGTYFQAYFPEGWSVVRGDVDVGYGFRSQFIADDMYLNVDTTPSELRTGTVTVAQSARDIAASISSASPVTTETIDGLTLHSFTFRNNRGIDSIDIFFEVDGDGYAIVAGSASRPETAFAIARQVAMTVRSAA
jgi:serine/threonine protein kinase